MAASWLLVGVLATLLLLGRIFSVLPLPSLTGSGYGASGAGGTGSAVSIDGFVLTSDGKIIVSSGGRLLATGDNGASWTDVTPAALDRRSVEGLSTARGTTLVVAASDSIGATGTAQTIVLRSGDDGATWAAAALPEGTMPGRASISFPDSQHGWLMIHDFTGASASLGELFRSDDGGASWRRMPAPPVGGEISFASPLDGWLAGGPLGDQLYHTADGGSTWTRRDIGVPAAYAALTTVYAAPSFFGPDEGVMPVTLAGGSRSPVAYFTTNDGGASWNLARVIATKESVLPPSRVATDVQGPAQWEQVEEDPSGATTTVTIAGVSRSTTSNTLPLDPANSVAIETQWADATRGWALIYSEQCAKGKEMCSEGNQLLSTDDAGASWREVPVPAPAATS